MDVELILTRVCLEFGVTRHEIRYGTSLRACSGSVSLARGTYLWRAWRFGATPRQAGAAIGLGVRSARKWYADFRAREARRPKAMREVAA